MTIKIEGTRIILDEQPSSPPTPPANKVALYAKSDGNLYQRNDAGLETQLGGSGGGSSFAELRYQVPQNGAAQTIPAATWTTLTLNTETSDPDSIVTISSNKFKPIAGTYLMWAIVQLGSGSLKVALRLQNVTSSTTITRSTNTLTPSNSAQFILPAFFTSNGTDEFAIQAYSNNTAYLGFALNIAAVGDEVYMQIILQKVG